LIDAQANRSPDRSMRFLAESYWSESDPADVTAAIRAIRRAAAARPSSCGDVRLVRCLLSPADELFSWLFEADSEAAVRATAISAGVDLERISAAVELWPRRRMPRS